MGIRAIFYRDGRFSNEASWGISPTAVGKDIVQSLMQGREQTDFGVTVNYAVEMLRITGRTGDFLDSTDWCSGDHEFDPNTPTVGQDWGKVRALRRDADRVESLALDLENSSFASVAVALFAIADDLRDSADSLDVPSVVAKPIRHGVTLPTINRSQRDVGAEAIWYDQGAGVFNFGGHQLGLAKLGRVIANALMRGDERVSLGEFTVTVNYLVQMCRLAGRFGRFVNYNDDLFDGNQPPALGYREFTDFALLARQAEFSVA